MIVISFLLIFALVTMHICLSNKFKGIKMFNWLLGKQYFLRILRPLNTFYNLFYSFHCICRNGSFKVKVVLAQVFFLWAKTRVINLFM